MQTIENMARIVAEVLANVGWNGDPNAIAERVRRLQQGLPAEDEFSVVCTWLGRCKLIHKLDQSLAPKSASEDYGVPDLFAVFEKDGRRVPVFIEVKNRNENTLSFRPDHLQKLRAYAEMTGIPMLIAWKHRYGIWTLFDIDALQLAKTNFNISFQDAMKQSLLGVLAGDFSYTLHRGAGVHLQFRKVKLVSEEQVEDSRVQKWHTVCDRVWISGENGQEIVDVPMELAALLIATSLQSRTHESATHIVQSFAVDEQQAEFGHTALVRLLDWGSQQGSELLWRNILERDLPVPGLNDFRELAIQGLNKGLVRYVFDIRPADMPAFLLEPRAPTSPAVVV